MALDQGHFHSYVGVDGGSSKTRILLSDAWGRLLADVSGPGINFQDIGVAKATSNLKHMFKDALRQAKRRPDSIAGAGFGMAGADRPEDFVTIGRFIRKATGLKSFRLVNDVDLMLRLGSPKGIGVAVVAGTSTNSVGRNGKGEEMHVGGWVGNPAGGVHLGWQGMLAAIEGYDGRGPKTRLTALICRHYGVKKLEDVLVFSYYDQRRKRALKPQLLAPLVFAAARRGDKVALGLLRQEAAALALIASVHLKKLFGSREQVTVTMGGSLLQKAKPDLIRQTLMRDLRKLGRPLKFVVTDTHPAFGALAYGFDQAGHSVPAPILELSRSKP